MSAMKSAGNGGVGSIHSGQPLIDEVASATPSRPMLTPRARVAIALGVAALGGAGYSALHAGEETTDNAQIMADVVAIPAQTGGLLTEIAFEDNQPVEKGKVLARIEPSAQKARLAEAEADLAAAKLAARSSDAEASIVEVEARGARDLASASLRGTHAAASSSREGIAAAMAEADAAAVAVRQAKQEVERAEKLYNDGATTRQEFERAKNAYDAALANLAAAGARSSEASSLNVAALSRIYEARARLDQATPVEERIARAQSQKELAHARVDAAQAARDAAAIELSYTTVVAGRSGTASNRTVSAGQMIAAGQPITNVVATDDMWVVANFKETQIGRMHPGQKAKIAVDSYGGWVTTGEVASLSGGTGAVFSLLPPENATGNFTKVVQRIPVRIRLASLPTDKPLRAGMSVVVTVDVRGG
jgi:membrane fusion protein, multidrug efflux system